MAKDANVQRQNFPQCNNKHNNGIFMFIEIVMWTWPIIIIT